MKSFPLKNEKMAFFWFGVVNMVTEVQNGKKIEEKADIIDFFCSKTVSTRKRFS